MASADGTAWAKVWAKDFGPDGRAWGGRATAVTTTLPIIRASMAPYFSEQGWWEG